MSQEQGRDRFRVDCDRHQNTQSPAAWSGRAFDFSGFGCGPGKSESRGQIHHADGKKHCVGQGKYVDGHWLSPSPGIYLSGLHGFIQQSPCQLVNGWHLAEIPIKLYEISVRVL